MRILPIKDLHRAALRPLNLLLCLGVCRIQIDLLPSSSIVTAVLPYLATSILKTLLFFPQESKTPPRIQIETVPSSTAVPPTLPKNPSLLFPGIEVPPSVGLPCPPPASACLAPGTPFPSVSLVGNVIRAVRTATGRLARQLQMEGCARAQRALRAQVLQRTWELWQALEEEPRIRKGLVRVILTNSNVSKLVVELQTGCSSKSNYSTTYSRQIRHVAASVATSWAYLALQR
jgi:hypothetical protein